MLQEGKDIIIIHDSMATSSSKVTVELKSDGLGGSIYGSINSSEKNSSEKIKSKDAGSI